MLTPWSVKALGVTGSFWRHHRSRPWISYSADSRCTQDDFNLATSLWINCLGAKHEFDFVKLRKSSPCHKAQKYGCHRWALRSCWRKKLICSEGRHTKDFGSIYFSVPETLPRMLKKHAAKDGVSPAMRRAKSERVSVILSLSLFLVRGRVSIETHAFFHLIKTAVFRPVVSRSAMSNKWIRESDDLL